MTCIFQAGQAPHTADCGYFCSFVLKRYRELPGGPWRMTREEVIQARDAFKQQQGMPRGNFFASVQTIVNFLGFLNVTGYLSTPFLDSFRTPRSQASFTARVESYIQTPGNGVILLLESPGATAGHYIAVLNRQGSNWCCYDPLQPSMSRNYDPSVIAGNFWNYVTYFIHC